MTWSQYEIMAPGERRREAQKKEQDQSEDRRAMRAAREKARKRAWKCVGKENAGPNGRTKRPHTASQRACAEGVVRRDISSILKRGKWEIE